MRPSCSSHLARRLGAAYSVRPCDKQRSLSSVAAAAIDAGAVERGLASRVSARDAVGVEPPRKWQIRNANVAEAEISGYWGGER